MSMIFIATGNYHLGCNSKKPQFEFCDDGGCVVVGKIDPITNEQIGYADIYGDYNAMAYMEKALDLLSPKRTVDIPNFKEIICNAYLDGNDICDYCQDFQCSNCAIKEWKEEIK